MIAFDDQIAVAAAPHHVEHLAPLCSLINMPLIALNEQTYHTALDYYPNIRVEIRGSYDSRDQIAAMRALFKSEFHSARAVYYSNLYTRSRLREIFEHRSQPLRVVYCPHGFSEKRQRWSAMAGYQDVTLLHGINSLRQLASFGVAHELSMPLYVGDYRFRFYREYQNFFDELLRLEIEWMSTRPTVLYAPTWEDGTGSCSASIVLELILSNLPANINLLVKPHPLLYRSDMFRRIGSALPGTHANVRFASCPALVFPYLERAAAFIGDMSSIGYDCLLYKFPLFFLDPCIGGSHSNSDSELFRVGRVVPPNSFPKLINLVLAEIEKNPSVADLDARTRLYRQVYEDVDLPVVKQRLIQIPLTQGAAWLTPANRNRSFQAKRSQD